MAVSTYYEHKARAANPDVCFHRSKTWVTNGMTFGFFLLAAFFEIAGCYAFWAWWKQDESQLWVIPGIISLVVFAWILAQVEASYAGRAYAAYGGVYIAASLLWGAAVEKQPPNGYDLLGVAFCFAGAALIFFSETLKA